MGVLHPSPSQRSPLMSALTHMFCEIDDFCKQFEPEFERRLLQSKARKRRRASKLSLSEIMTIIVHFHRASYRTFKDYYTKHVMVHLRSAFPDLVSYNRFVELMPRAVVALCCFLNTRKGDCTGISFVDSTALAVCHNRRIHSHKVFDGWAQRGRTSTGYFYGFKLHIVVSDEGELLAFRLTPGNTDDREPVPDMAEDLFGKLFGDKGYISKKLFEELFQHELELVTKLRKNMKNKLIPLFDKLMLRKRSLIETIYDQLKNISQIEHSRHRSLAGFIVNLLAGLVAYTYQPKKPSLNLRKEELDLLPALVS
jgi:hypothetical protein